MFGVEEKLRQFMLAVIRSGDCEQATEKT